MGNNYTYKDLTKFARICANNSYITTSREAAQELWRMALEYQNRAAALDNGKLPDIGQPPPWFVK